MNFKKIAAALVLLPLFILLVGWGSVNTLLIVVLILVQGLGFYEYANIAFKDENGKKPVFEIILGLFFSCLVCFFTTIGFIEPIMIIAALSAAFLLIAVALMLKEKDLSRVLEKAAKVFFGVVLLGFCGGLIVALKAMEPGAGGVKLVGVLFALTWINDAGAYFAGTALGKRKLAPNLSPNKTIEGAVGGFLATMLLAAGIGYFTDFFPIYDALWLGFIMGFIGPLGDLFESALKRGAKVKDSGLFMPGHGGVFDRIDSVLFNAPILYIYVFFMIF